MQALDKISQELAGHLGLHFGPVGVNLFKKGMALPENIYTHVLDMAKPIAMLKKASAPGEN